MIFESLPFERWSEVKPFLATFGENGLPNRLAQMFILREEKELLGLTVVEPLLQCGPFYLKQSLRNTNIGGLLIRNVDKVLPRDIDVAVIALNEQTEKMCASFGLEEVQGKMYLREAK